MRWPFGRSSRPDAGSPSPASAGGERLPVDRPRDAWRSLPAVQRAIGAPPTVAPAKPFAASLATRQAPGLALAQLGHEVSPLASAGIVVGLAAPAGAALSGRVDLLVQRLAAQALPEAAESPGWSSFESSGSGLEAVSADAGGRQLPAAMDGPAMVAQRVAPSMTSSIATSLPAALAGTFDLRPATPGAVPFAAGPVLASVAPTATEPVPGTSIPVGNDLPARRPTLGQARRLGLGVPLSASSEHAIQRVALPGAARAAPAGSATSASSATGQPIVMPGAASSAPGRAGGAPAGDRPDPAPSAGWSGTETPGQARPTAPGERPAWTVVHPTSIQRLAPALPGGPADPDRPGRPIGAATIGSAGPSDRGTPSGAQRGGDEPAGRAGTRPDELGDPGPTIQLLVDAPLGGLPIRVTSAGSLLEPASLGESRGPGALPADRPLPGPEPVAARAIASQGPGPEPRPRPEAGGPAVMRIVASARPPTAVMDAAPGPGRATLLPPVQRAVEVNEVPIHPNGADPSAGGDGANGSSGGQGQPAGLGSAAASPDKDRELDDLARRLYGRIRSRLSAELLADRERGGVITDLR